MSVCAWLVFVVFAVAATADMAFVARFSVAWKQERRPFWIAVIMVIGFLFGYGIS